MSARYNVDPVVFWWVTFKRKRDTTPKKYSRGEWRENEENGEYICV